RYHSSRPQGLFRKFSRQLDSAQSKQWQFSVSFSTGASNPDCILPKPPVADETHLYVAGLDGVVYSFDAASGRIVWKRKLPAEPSTSLVLKDYSLFVGRNDNHIYRLKSESGATHAEIAVEAKPVGRPMFSGDSLLFFLENLSDRAGYVFISLGSDLS